MTLRSDKIVKAREFVLSAMHWADHSVSTMFGDANAEWGCTEQEFRYAIEELCAEGAIRFVRPGVVRRINPTRIF